MAAYKAALTEQQRLAEDRLAYVAATRAKRLLVGIGPHLAGRPGHGRGRRSTYLRAIIAEAARAGPAAGRGRPAGAATTRWSPRPAPHPVARAARPGGAAPPAGGGRRGRAGRRRRFAETGELRATRRRPPLLLDGEERAWPAGTPTWTGCWPRPAAARSGSAPWSDCRPSCRRPPCCGCSADPQALRRRAGPADAAPPSRAARFGTRFHLWVERYFGRRRPTGGVGQQQLVDPDDLPDRADAGSHDEAELRELCDAFAAGRFGQTGAVRGRGAVQLLIDGRLVRGRIDAVYDAIRRRTEGLRVPGGRLEDQPDRDGRPAAARHLPAGLGRGQPDAGRSEVDAVFYYVRTDQAGPARADLPDRAELGADSLDGDGRLTERPD